MSETTFLLGLFGSMALMFVALGTWLGRPVPPGPLEIPLGPRISAGALGATLLAFVLGADVRQCKALRTRLFSPEAP